MMGGWDRWWLGDGMVDSYKGVGGGTGGGYYLIVFFTCAFVFCSFVSPVLFLKHSFFVPGSFN